MRRRSSLVLLAFLVVIAIVASTRYVRGELLRLANHVIPSLD